MTVYNNAGGCVTYQPDHSRVVKAVFKMAEVGEVDGFSVKETIPTILEGRLPDETDGVLLLVNRAVFQAMNGRDDLICPGPSRKDKDGVIIGCWGFSI